MAQSCEVVSEWYEVLTKHQHWESTEVEGAHSALLGVRPISMFLGLLG